VLTGAESQQLDKTKIKINHHFFNY